VCSRHSKTAAEGFFVLVEFTKELCCILDAKADVLANMDSASASESATDVEDENDDPELVYSNRQDRKHATLVAKCESAKKALLDSAAKARKDTEKLRAAVSEADPRDLDSLLVLEGSQPEPLTPAAPRMQLSDFVSSP
jgi:DNA-directed RNA polymerase subunit F